MAENGDTYGLKRSISQPGTHHLPAVKSETVLSTDEPRLVTLALGLKLTGINTQTQMMFGMLW